jgi:glutaredoxin
MRYVLLGTAACHLCEQAQEIIHDCGLSVELIDIAEQEHWQERYALRIPVLIDKQSQQELAWPFAQADVQLFVQ